VPPDDAILFRTCRVCGVAKPASAEFFYIHGPRMRAECKDCFKQLKNARYASNPEGAREVARVSYHKVDGAAAKRRARSGDPERYAAIAARYEGTHSDERHTKRLARHEANRDRDRDASKDWYYANYERARETTDRWAREHPDEVSVRNERVRAKRRAAPGEVTSAQWGTIRRRFRSHCAYCGQPGQTFEMEHVVPLGRGGTHTPDNVVPACFACNRSKAGKLFEEWTAERVRRQLPVPATPEETLRRLDAARILSMGRGNAL
jgi:5-methylcytosine-specific restriction endonuclease McrA